MILPVSAAVKAMAVLCWPNQETLLVTLSIELAIHYSIFQASKELLYTPTRDEIRFRAKTMIDTFVFRLGAGMAALVVLFVLLDRSQASISGCILVTATASLGVSYWLQKHFRQLTN